MFRLAAFTDEISHDLDRACAVLEEFGAEGVEIRGVWHTGCQDLSDAQVADIKRIVADHGLKVASMGSPFGKCELDQPDQVARHMDILRRCADIGLELGCSLVRGFAFWGHGRREKPWSDMLRAYEPVPAILEEKGVILGLENEAACYVGTAGHTRCFLDLLRSPNVKALWDPANHVQDPDSDTEPVFPDGYELVKDDLVHVHVKDAIIEEDGTRPNVFLGQGLCCWAQQLEAFRHDGFDGYVSLETHVNPDRFPEDMQAKYGHYLTGEGREGASKVCLAWLREAMDTLV
ncbi:MAG TPA: sugar phosphate isomerase/epimerase family protein [Candidatus Hydrogenedentes bacterium]|nr:sugar phosphate isomerase/epimerase family protein [Candidatus Hydrogenedentota bacterium]HPG65670.1 sugar phosphate isomerase/epimerase family protein [Candidatus Hydrogenedentota bacterium]